MSRFPVSRKDQGTALGRHRGNPADQLQREMDSLFGRLFSGLLAPAFSESASSRLWDLDVRDEGNRVRVRAEMPGFEPDEIDLRIDNNALTIRAESEQRGDGHEEYLSYFRTITLPPGTDPDKVRASYRNGVLELDIPKSEAAGARRIQIEGQRGAGPSESRSGGAGASGAPGATAQGGAAGSAGTAGTSGAGSSGGKSAGASGGGAQGTQGAARPPAGSSQSGGEKR